MKIILLSIAIIAIVLIVPTFSFSWSTAATSVCTVHEASVTDRYGDTFAVVSYSKDQPNRASFIIDSYWSPMWSAQMSIVNHAGKVVYLSPWKTMNAYNAVTFSYSAQPKQTTYFIAQVAIDVPNIGFYYTTPKLYFVVSC